MTKLKIILVCVVTGILQIAIVVCWIVKPWQLMTECGILNRECMFTVDDRDEYKCDALMEEFEPYGGDDRQQRCKSFRLLGGRPGSLDPMLRVFELQESGKFEEAQKELDIVIKLGG